MKAKPKKSKVKLRKMAPEENLEFSFAAQPILDELTNLSSDTKTKTAPVAQRLLQTLQKSK